MVDLIDTNGVKPTLKKGVLGYDDYNAGGDAGRLYVGTGTASIAQAKKSEVDAKVSKVTSTDNAIVRFNGTTGDVQNSGVIIDDNNNIGSGIAPSEKLHLHNGSASNTFIKTQNTAGTALFGTDNLGSLYAWSSDAGVAYVGTSKATGVINFHSGGGQKAVLDANGSLLIGTSNAQRYVSIDGGNTGTGDGAFYKVINNGGNICAFGNYSGIVGGAYDSTATVWSNNSLKFITDGGANVRATIDSVGNLLLTSGTGGLGYGIGAGGTVTQLTSKSTAVTLNKPSGQIVTHNSALAANAGISFVFSNSLLGSSDTVTITCNSFNYRVSIIPINAGNCYVLLENRTSVSLSDALTLNFAIIKGSNL